jgi:hypothetical protein
MGSDLFSICYLKIIPESGNKNNIITVKKTIDLLYSSLLAGYNRFSFR